MIGIMSPQLCPVCHNIPDDFWSMAHDLFETRRGAKAKLQSCHSMLQQKKKGCHFCTLLLDCLQKKTLVDPNECLYLWRDYYEPHRAFCIGTASFRESLGSLYFFRVPNKWCVGPITRLGDGIDNRYLMKTWLSNRTSVNESVLNQARQFLPTRLLDVLAFQKSDDVRLVTSQDLRTTSAPPYLALSHCWGGTVPVQLKAENLKGWVKSGIPLKTLPKTFRDAVEITKQLDCRYLWIDSMCIIQDSESDWTQEASLMAEVYGNARCTLAALNSKNSSQGWRLQEDIQTSLGCPYIELEVTAYKSSRVRIFRKKPLSWIDEFEGHSSQTSVETQSPLSTRAWVLQEKELSNCTIYFAECQLLWENGPNRATAQVPWQELKPQTQSETPRLLCENTSRQMVAAPRYPWYKLVEDYTSRFLSFPADKLVAFSGLAKKFSSGDRQYCAGIWSTDLPAALLWRVKDSKATRPAYLAPSWSWASLMGSITYDSLELDADNSYAHYEDPEDIYPGLATLRVERTHIVLADKGKPFGDVREGSISLRGARCIKVECSTIAVRFSDGGQPLNQNGVNIGVFYPDLTEKAARSKEIYCVVLQSESVWSSHRHEFRLKQDSAMTSMVMGMVVARVPQTQRYRRVGLARWIDESLFDAVRTTTLELV